MAIGAKLNPSARNPFRIRQAQGDLATNLEIEAKLLQAQKKIAYVLSLSKAQYVKAELAEANALIQQALDALAAPSPEVRWVI